MSRSVGDKMELYSKIAGAFLVAKHRLPKELASETKLLARIGGVPGEMLAKFEAIIDHISGPNYAVRNKR